MAKKLYFKYGTMGSSKTAQALIAKFNYEEKGMKVWLIKPQLDNRDGDDILRSRIGLTAKAYVVREDEDLWQSFNRLPGKIDVIIADEAQFFQKKQSAKRYTFLHTEMFRTGTQFRFSAL